MTHIGPFRPLVFVLLAACATADVGATGAEEDGEGKEDRLVLTHVAVAGDLRAGETSPPIEYRDPPLYAALRFVAPAGDEVELVVHSDDGDGFVRLLDAKYTVIATARADGPDATLRVRLGDADPVHYVAFRDHARRDATFTVTWRDAGFFPGLYDEALEQALHDEMDGHTSVGYEKARKVMFDATAGIDMGGGVVTCVYTATQAANDGSPTPPNFSIEHVWPQSLGAGTEPMRSDLHHLLPAIVPANSARNNHLYGETRCGQEGERPCEWQGGGSFLGHDAAGQLVFMPRPARRGDVARATFYFAARYGTPIPADEEAVLKAWNDADPPDDDERRRNEAVQRHQGNRNLFIDDPTLVHRIADL